MRAYETREIVINLCHWNGFILNTNGLLSFSFRIFILVYSLPSSMISDVCLCVLSLIGWRLGWRFGWKLKHTYTYTVGNSLLLDYCISCQLTISLYKGQFNIHTFYIYIRNNGPDHRQCWLVMGSKVSFHWEHKNNLHSINCLLFI